jgi:hypothetical protein
VKVAEGKRETFGKPYRGDGVDCGKEAMSRSAVATHSALAIHGSLLRMNNDDVFRKGRLVTRTSSAIVPKPKRKSPGGKLKP